MNVYTIKVEYGGSVRHALDHACPVHGSKHREPPHCATCTCGVGSQIVQTTLTAKAQVHQTEGEKK